MKAAVLPAARRIEIEDRPVPEPGPDDIVVRIASCGICGTDQHIFEGGGHLPIHFPLIPGHEMAGEVVEAGKSVAHLRPGDRVALDPNIPCGHCFWCQRGEVHLCANLQALGVTRSGGFAGRRVSGAVDLAAADLRASDVRDLVDRIDFSQLRMGMPQPDRYVYEFRTPTGERAVVQEQDLTDDLRRLASLVLDD